MVKCLGKNGEELNVTAHARLSVSFNDRNN